MDSPIHILLVDEDQDFIRQTRRTFEPLGAQYILTTALSLDDARAHLQRTAPHLLLLDWRLLDGGALEGLSLQDSGFPVVALINQGEETRIEEALTTGAQDFFLKTERSAAALPYVIERILKEWNKTFQLEHTQAALTQSEKILQSLPDIIYRLDPVGNITFVNQAVTAYGYTVKELIGMSVFELIHPDDREKVRFRINERRTGLRRTRSLEARLLTRDQKIAVFEMYDFGVESDRILSIDAEGIYSAKKSETACFLGTLGIARDITERKQAEKAQRESDEKYKMLFERTADAVMVINNGLFVDCNDAAVNLLRYENRNQILNTHPSDLSPEKQPCGRSSYEKANEIIALAFEKGSHRFEWVHKRADGEVFPVEVILTAIPMGEKKILHVVWRDITERKQAEIALRESEEYLRAIFQASPFSIAINRRSDGVIVDVNDTYINNSGYSREELIGKKPTDLDLFMDFEDYARIKEMIYRDGFVSGYEIKKRNKQGKITTGLVYSRIIELRGEQYILSLVIDITEKKELEEQLLQAQKMETIGVLAGSVAHDFNNLLTCILGYSAMALSDLHIEDPLRPKIMEIHTAGKRAASLTRQLLAFSRRQAMQPRKLNLNQVLLDMEKMLSRLIGETIELVTLTDPNLGTVIADPGQIEQIIMNLAVNARDAMPQGGKLTIETSNILLEHVDPYKFIELETGPYVSLSISDTGCGMDDDTKKHIFEPFFTTKQKGKGTGLGLSTVYGIVKQSGGDIFVYSEVGKGTVFKIYLPRVDEEAEPDKTQKQRAKSTKGTETIMLVEDEEIVRDMITHVLGECGYTILATDSYDEAMKANAKWEGSIHLLITDVVLPRMSGRDMAEKLTSLRPGVKVLFISGYTDDTVAQHGILEEGVHFLEKPFTPKKLSEKVRAILDA